MITKMLWSVKKSGSLKKCLFLWVLFVPVWASNDDDLKKIESFLNTSNSNSYDTYRDAVEATEGNPTILHHLTLNPHAIRCETSNDTNSEMTHEENRHLLFLTGKAGDIKDPLYHEPLCDFAKKNGVFIHCFSWPYHGLSTPHLPNPMVIHGDDNLSVYRNALEQYLHFGKKNLWKESDIDVIALSMGACILLDTLIQDQPNQNQANHDQQGGQKCFSFIRRLVLLSPMAGIPSPANDFVTYAVVHTLSNLGLGDRFGFGQKPFNAERSEGGFKKRPECDIEKVKKHIAYAKDNNGRNGVSNGWTKGAYQMMSRVNRNAFKIENDILVITPCKDDIVPTKRQLILARSFPNRKVILFNGGPHDPFLASQTKINLLMESIKNFLDHRSELLTPTWREDEKLSTLTVLPKYYSVNEVMNDLLDMPIDLSKSKKVSHEKKGDHEVDKKEDYDKDDEIDPALWALLHFVPLLFLNSGR